VGLGEAEEKEDEDGDGAGVDEPGLDVADEDVRKETGGQGGKQG
jgi:hypothetical protein